MQCIFCATRNEEPSSSLPQWPNVEFKSVTTNSEAIINNISQTKPLLEQPNGDLNKHCQLKMAANVDNIYFSYGSGKKAVDALNGITIKVPEGNM